VVQSRSSLFSDTVLHHWMFAAQHFETMQWPDTHRWGNYTISNKREQISSNEVLCPIRMEMSDLTLSYQHEQMISCTLFCKYTTTQQIFDSDGQQPCF